MNLKCMFKYLLTIIFIIITTINLQSQGFDWQWSARFPVINPQNYYGFNVNYGINYSIGNITFRENNVSCPDFINANGNNIGFGINYIYWERNNSYAVYGALRYNNFSISTNSIDNVPITDDIIAQYKITLDCNFHQIDLQCGINYRVINYSVLEHFFLGAGIEIGTIVNNDFVAMEEILGPPEVPPFSTNPKSYKREITSGQFNKINKFNIKPQVKIGYNLELGRGSYIEPNICFSIPLRSMFSDDKINHYSILFGINFFTCF